MVVWKGLVFHDRFSHDILPTHTHTHTNTKIPIWFTTEVDQTHIRWRDRTHISPFPEFSKFLDIICIGWSRHDRETTRFKNFAYIRGYRAYNIESRGIES